MIQRKSSGRVTEMLREANGDPWYAGNIGLWSGRMRSCDGKEMLQQIKQVKREPGDVVWVRKRQFPPETVGRHSAERRRAWAAELQSMLADQKPDDEYRPDQSEKVSPAGWPPQFAGDRCPNVGRIARAGTGQGEAAGWHAQRWLDRKNKPAVIWAFRDTLTPYDGTVCDLESGEMK
jgi:hypothetical protein